MGKEVIMKIGIYGGSFNPPHKMHESIGKQLLEKQLLDFIIFVPTSNDYPKAGLIHDYERYEMLNLIVEEEEHFSVSNYEFGRRTYTYETLEYFQKQYPRDDIYFICGSDNLAQFDTWKCYQEILKNYRVIVIPREENIRKLLVKYQKYRSHIQIVPLENNFLSSTLVREYLKNQDYEKVEEFIHPKVLAYIQDKNLYRE